MAENTGVHPGGRPTKYKPEFNTQAYKLCLLGATDKQLADFFDVEEKTVNNWKDDYPEFLQSIKAGKDEADSVIAESLFHRAKGFSHPEDKIFNDDGTPLIVPTTKHYPPDTAACIFWLKNRQKAQWRDKVETELTGADGQPLGLEINVVYGKDPVEKGSD
ncbi:MAG: terminase [Firmicutes bacterium]|nr:terminase [Bacillota bacterium]